LTTHRFPAASKARPVGFTRESPAVRRNAGGGDPDAASCAAVYLEITWNWLSDTQSEPAASKAMATGLPGKDRTTAGA
jgi:hypothetical protein